jgi:GDP/UDP-N,N'-diacetylbacillosamine 2-epimerase (hydrolysing)
MSIKKILAFTAIRSDYDLMSGIYKKIQLDPEMELGLIVSGAHLSDTYGNTVKYIEQDGVEILARIECLIDSNTPASRVLSASILLQSCIHTVQQFNPDLIIYPGDREEVMVGALIGSYLRIPTAHFFGGDHAADGNADNPVRHAVSKLSSLHFVSHPQHKERLLKMGETERRIFVIGNPALDRFIQAPCIEKKELLAKMDRSHWSDYALLIFHPILGGESQAGEYFSEILLTLKRRGIKTFVSYPNVDAGNKDIIEVIEKFTCDENFCFYKSLERALFINLMKNALFMIGNSSSGLLEAPSIPLGVVNVGNRQRGRLAAENVIFVDQGVSNIESGISKVLDLTFKENLSNIKSPYGEGNSVNKAMDLLKRINFRDFQSKWEDPLA